LRPATDNPQNIEPNTITLMVVGAPGKTASLHLLDATTGSELAKVERIDVTILDL
jgi:hypothetical protein